MNTPIESANQFKTFTTQQIIFAVAPFCLAFSSSMLNWFWKASGWPNLLNVPPTYIGALIILLAGSFIGVKRGFPAWSYSWFTQLLANISPLTGTLLAIIFMPSGVFFAGIDDSVYQLINQGINQLLVFTALIFSLTLAKHSKQDALFFFLLYLAARTTTFPIQTSETLIMSSLMTTWTLAFITILELIVTSVILFKFLIEDPESWRPFWYLSILIFIDPALKLWPLAIEGGAASIEVAPFLSALGIMTIFNLAHFGIAYGAIHLYRNHIVHENVKPTTAQHNNSGLS